MEQIPGLSLLLEFPSTAHGFFYYLLLKAFDGTQGETIVLLKNHFVIAEKKN